MKKFIINNVKSAIVTAEKDSGKIAITANKKASEKMAYPFTDGKVYSADGSCYRSLHEFFMDYKELEFSLTEDDEERFDSTENEEENNNDDTPIQILSEVAKSGKFETITELKQIFVSYQQKYKKEPKIVITLTITAGKFRPNGKAKKWFDKNTKVTAEVDAIKNKWLFLKGSVYVKDFVDATYVIS